MIKERFLIPHDQVLAQDVLAPRPSSSTRPESLPGGVRADNDVDHEYDDYDPG